MTPEERYLFDLRGYLIVRDALEPSHLQELNAALTKEMEKGSLPDEAGKHRFQRVVTWGSAYLRLLDNPRITPYLDELIGADFRLDNDYADVIPAGACPNGTGVHGGGTPFDPSIFFTFRDQRMRNGLMAVAYYLRDVQPGEGGFACVPGSHKANYLFPEQWRNLREFRHDCVTAITGPAGMAIVFTEALSHATLPWLGQHQRRTIFYKYGPPAISWAAQYYDPNDFDDANARQRAILEPPNARYGGRKLVTRR